jgi:hypothetical protein
LRSDGELNQRLRATEDACTRQELYAVLAGLPTLSAAKRSAELIGHAERHPASTLLATHKDQGHLNEWEYENRRRHVELARTQSQIDAALRDLPVLSSRQPSRSYLLLSDADRNAALARLSEHRAAGRITYEEYDSRMGIAMQARTRADLDAALSDLPSLLGTDTKKAINQGAQTILRVGSSAVLKVLRFALLIGLSLVGGCGRHSHRATQRC